MDQRKHLKPCAIKRLQRRADARRANKEQLPTRTVIRDENVDLTKTSRLVLISPIDTDEHMVKASSSKTVEKTVTESVNTVEKPVLIDSTSRVSNTAAHTVNPTSKPKQFSDSSTQTEPTHTTCMFCLRRGMILSTCQGCTKYLDSFREDWNEQESKRWKEINRVENRKPYKPKVPKPTHKPTFETLKYTVEKNEEIPDFAAHIDRHREQLAINMAKEKVEAKKKRLHEAEESASRVADVLSRPEVAKTGIRTREDRVFLNSKYKSNRITHNNQPVPSKTNPATVSNHSSINKEKKHIEQVAITPSPHTPVIQPIETTTVIDDDFSRINEDNFPTLG